MDREERMKMEDGEGGGGALAPPYTLSNYYHASYKMPHQFHLYKFNFAPNEDLHTLRWGNMR